MVWYLKKCVVCSCDKICDLKDEKRKYTKKYDKVLF